MNRYSVDSFANITLIVEIRNEISHKAETTILITKYKLLLTNVSQFSRVALRIKSLFESSKNHIENSFS